jgi:hypothetical protein
MDAVRTSETSVYSNETTRRCIPEGSSLVLRIWTVSKPRVLIPRFAYAMFCAARVNVS